MPTPKASLSNLGATDQACPSTGGCPAAARAPAKAGQCSFSREEVQQILPGRNELKANLFLLKEELATTSSGEGARQGPEAQRRQAHLFPGLGSPRLIL